MAGRPQGIVKEGMAKVIFLSSLIAAYKCGGGLKYEISGKAGDDGSVVKIRVV